MTNKQKAILYNLFAGVAFGGMNLFVQLSGDLPVMQKSFFRNAGALLVAAFLILSQHVGFKVPRKAWPSLFARSLCGTLCILLTFYSVDRLPLADANMLTKLAPFFALFFSVLLLKEKIRLFHGVVMLLAFLGSLLIIKPSFDNILMFPSFVALAAAATGGLAAVAVRKTSQMGSPGLCTIFYFSLMSTLVVLPFFVLDFQPMTLYQFACLLGVGICAGIGQFGFTKAYALAPSREVSIYEYSQVIFAAIMGFVVFGQLPDALSWMGYLIIFGMSLLMFMYNNKMAFFKNVTDVE